MNNNVASRQAIKLVNAATELSDCIKDLATQPSIAFDLEFDNNLRSYGITLCLIQVATPETCYLIDPLAGLDLSALYEVFNEERIQKIVHSPGEDLRLLHSLGCFPKNIFDVQVVAILLNYELISLAALLAQKLDLNISKGQQRSDWRQRPLSEAQIQYAAADVIWLHQLKELLIEEAVPKNLMPFILEEQESLSNTIYKVTPKHNFLKSADQHKLSPWDQHVLNGLFRYRDYLARKLNKPAFQVMDETVLRELADGKLSVDELKNQRGLHHSLKSSEGREAVSKALTIIKNEANLLSLATVVSARKHPSQEDRLKREQAAKDQIEKFKPIQEQLAQEYGLFTARFVLSNGSVNDLLNQTTSLNQLKPYRRELVLKMAQKVGIDLSDYL